MTRIAVVGLGLIGGSFALAVKARRKDCRVVAIDAEHVIASEAARRAADELIDHRNDAAVCRAIASADLTVLSTPVRAIEGFVAEALEHAKVLTDCGSTKRRIAAAAAAAPRGRRFVPGHPMAGRPSSGLGEASADLFEGSVWILCPEGADPDAFELVGELVRTVGAVPVAMSAADHDRAVALTSHVPQLLASALAVLSDRRSAGAAAGPAFASATRVAGGQDSMWSDIFATNADEIAAALRALEAELAAVAAELEKGANTRALELLARARGLRRA